ncbi:transglycosylase SLT domain-containing protein [Paenirhodobacter populi]|uniref:Lytic transglycosylase n=1 Tax=Paenirhodobacter populi TaxID=2306993 RepID=A0A443K4V7_9RHOB|nr:lytic transglycosylase [Sinirhodobacter populi]RWR06653.1 lytic transglycosylase [Sinirhodobacter populi]RWR27786.1 lytic transglycosylase [Sinirhodobacter populi]
MNKFLKLAILLMVASCGGGGSQAPRNLDNACLLAREKPQYFAAMKRTEARWGVPVHVQMATFHQESKFIGNAKTPHRYALGIIPLGRQSSALGYSQAIDSTWKDYQQSTGKRSARRTKFQDAADFMGWYMDGTTRSLGISKQDARNQYLAYHEGRSGFANGSHNSKGWLLSTATRVQQRANMYQTQLAGCRR